MDLDNLVERITNAVTVALVEELDDSIQMDEEITSAIESLAFTVAETYLYNSEDPSEEDSELEYRDMDTLTDEDTER